MSTPFGFALIGCGMIARYHARAIAEIPGARVAALVSRTPKNAQDLVERLRDAGAEVRYTEYPGMGHLIWPKVYDTAELYAWFAQKKKN